MQNPLRRLYAPTFGAGVPIGGLRLVAVAIGITVLASVRAALADDDFGRFIYPLSEAPNAAAGVTVFEVDTSESPDDEAMQKWADRARLLGQDWLPIVRRFLATNDWSPPPTIRLVFKKDLGPPAATANGVIYISVPYVQKHQDDFGMVIHELTHIVQNYPPGNPGWLVEGIADYIRYWKYEPEKPHRRIDATSSYKDGYGTSAAFLAWIVWKYDRRIVQRLDDALRHGRYHDGLFQEWTGKPVDALWGEFLGDQKG